MNNPWYEAKRFHVGPTNFAPEVQANFDCPPDRQVKIVDSTIRKLECTPGVRLSVENKVELALRSEALGAAEIFINNVHFVPDYFESAREIASRKHKLVLNVQTWLTDDWRAGLKGAMESGADFCEVEARTSDVELLRLGLDKAGMAARLKESLDYGNDHGAKMGAGFMDSTRADLSYLKDLVSQAIEHGAQKITLYDSFGVVSPEAVRFIIKSIKSVMTQNVPIIIHLHDSFGVATAGAAAAVTAGATHVDCAAYGLPSGIPLAPLEETVLTLELLYGLRTGIKLDGLYDYCKFVETLSGVSIGPGKPVVGEHIFLFESDNEVAEHLREAEVENLKPYAPSLIGRTARAVWDINTLRGDAVRAKLELMGATPTENVVHTVLERLKAKIDQMRSFPIWITESEVEAICHQVIDSQKQT